MEATSELYRRATKLVRQASRSRDTGDMIKCLTEARALIDEALQKERSANLDDLAIRDDRPSVSGRPRSGLS